MKQNLSFKTASKIALSILLFSTIYADTDSTKEQNIEKEKNHKTNIVEYTLETGERCINIAKRNRDLLRQIALLKNENKILKNMLNKAKNNINMLSINKQYLATKDNSKLLNNGYYRIVNYWQNVRIKPSSKSDIVAVLKKNDIVEVKGVIKKRSNIYWIKIRWKDISNNKNSYISGWIYVSNANDPSVKEALEKLINR